jgi:hypothetical protein
MENKNESIIEVEQVAPVKAKKGRKPNPENKKPKERTDKENEEKD